MTTTVQDIIAQMPTWSDAPDLTVEPIGGLTNTNHLLTVRGPPTANGERYVLRLSGANTALLGIDREVERQALAAASDAGIGPEVVRFFPEGHLITRWIDGRHWTVEEYRTPENLRRVVETVKRVHALPSVQGTFSPFRRVEAYAQHAQTFHAPLPEDWDLLVRQMRAIEADQRRDPGPWLRFCHNDLFSVNFLDDGSIRILDWEFAGMADIYFDLATLVYAYDEFGPLPEDLQTYMLECYFGRVEPAYRARLEGMKYMVLFFTAMWGLLQHGMQQAGLVPAPDDFDCLEYAHETFASMRPMLLKQEGR